ncbi:hypothetical protein KBTX_01367 [wastewater metagenome]|uniref:DUF2345 domain-containing protein n=3 Tax=root TaxID=1 RepID=A0A5B8RAT2_9ZZZZ|nr:hypothetical protein KBTEX_01367 [uncultured organism]
MRANQGLYLTTWGQPGAGGDQLDLTPAREQLASAHRLAERLSGSATAHRAEALEAHTDLQRAGEDAEHAYGNSEQVSAGGDQSSARRASETGGRGETPGLRAPWLHLASPAGITATTPASTHLAQGGALSVSSGEDVNIATGGSLVAAITRRLSLFVQRAGIKLFAARGNVDIHAHTGAIGIAAEKDVEARASQRKIDLAGAKEIVLTCGGARVRIRNGNIELHAPGRVSINGAQHSFSGPVEQETTTPVLPDDDPGLCPWKGRSAAASGEGGVEE